MYQNTIYSITKSCLISLYGGKIIIDRKTIDEKDIKLLLNDSTYTRSNSTQYYYEDDVPLYYYGKINGSIQYVFADAVGNNAIILNSGVVSLQPIARCVNDTQQIQRQDNSPLIYYLYPGLSPQIYRVTAKCFISLGPYSKKMLKKLSGEYDRNREIIRDSSQPQYTLDQEYVRDNVIKKYYGYLYTSPNSSNFTNQGSIANIFADENGQNVDVVKPTDVQYAPPKTKSFCVLL